MNGNEKKVRGEERWIDERERLQMEEGERKGEGEG